jgi:sugar phosphate isomerase/epimerase
VTAPVQIDRSKVKLGVTPTLWWNDDFPTIDIGVTFEQCVSEMALAGFEGCSVGHKYAKDPAVLSAALELRGLRVSEPWTSTYFCAGMNKIEGIAKSEEMRLCYHHHMGTGVMTRPDTDLKDVRPEVVAEVRDQHLSFQDAIEAGVFTVPGDGAIDFIPILQTLADNGFEGWLVVEAEQDPAKALPLEYAFKARKYLRKILGF